MIKKAHPKQTRPATLREGALFRFCHYRHCHQCITGVVLTSRESLPWCIYLSNYECTKDQRDLTYWGRCYKGEPFCHR